MRSKLLPCHNSLALVSLPRGPAQCLPQWLDDLEEVTRSIHVFTLKREVGKAEAQYSHPVETERGLSRWQFP